MQCTIRILKWVAFFWFINLIWPEVELLFKWYRIKRCVNRLVASIYITFLSDVDSLLSLIFAVKVIE
jgi:hypothetical protein